MRSARARHWHRIGSARGRVTVCAGAAAIIALAGCGSSGGGGGGSNGSGGSGSSGEYQLGATLGLTGPIAGVATPYSQGIQAYFSYVDAHGGINGHDVKFTALDDATNVTTGVANVKQLVTTDHVSAIYYILSNIQDANAPYLAQNKVVTVTQAVDATVVHPTQQYVFAGGIVEPDEATPMVSFGKTKLAGVAKPKAVVITTTSVALIQLDKNLQTDAKGAGMSVVGNQVVPLTATDMSSEASQFAAQKPNIVFSGLIATQEPSFVAAMRQAGFKGPIIQYDGGSSFPLMKQLADPNIYFLFPTSFGHNTGPQVTIMNAAAKAAGTSADAYFFSFGYVQGYIVGQALKTCGYPCDGTQLAANLQKLSNLDTGGLTFGNWNYSSADHSGIQSVAFFNWDPATSDAAQSGAPVPMPNN
jgi:branched-chain amino acid transport system substrate-binding protein